jgi:enoyl-CoA hydratase/carnithine racemase
MHTATGINCPAVGRPGVDRTVTVRAAATLPGVTDLPVGLDLDLNITEEGEPGKPLVFLPLDRWRDATPEQVAGAARMVAEALPVTAGLLTGPPAAGLEPLLGAASLTLSTGPAADQDCRLVPVGDLAVAAGRLQAAVALSPRAAVSCGQLLRQTAELGTGPGLAAEAAVYSMLLGGPEFARWLTGRGASRAAHAAARSPVRMSRAGSRLSVVLDDPGRRNALSFRMREALLEAVLLADADETITEVEISGAGPAFCSGGDLDEFGIATDLVAAYLVRLARAPWRVIDRISDRVTMRVHGACIGAGTELAAFGGRVVAAPGTFFALPEVSMGLVPGAGGSVSVPRRIGRWRAAWLMLTGERLAAELALSWGLVDELAGRLTGSAPGSPIMRHECG